MPACAATAIAARTVVFVWCFPFTVRYRYDHQRNVMQHPCDLQERTGSRLTSTWAPLGVEKEENTNVSREGWIVLSNAELSE